jgi:hypothetical protein
VWAPGFSPARKEQPAVSEGAQKKQEKPRKFPAIRGTRDFFPPDTALWNHVHQTAREDHRSAQTKTIKFKKRPELPC